MLPFLSKGRELGDGSGDGIGVRTWLCACASGSPIQAALLSNAAFAVTRMVLNDCLPRFITKERTRNAHISSSVMPLTSLAQSLYVLTAMAIDSVLLDVTAPVPSVLLYVPGHMTTISASILRTDGKTSGWSGLEKA